MIPETEAEEDAAISQGHLARLAEEVAKRLNQVSGPPAGPGFGNPGRRGRRHRSDESDTGLIDRLRRRALRPAWQTAASTTPPTPCATMYEMGDAPSCSVCGAIMVRNGSCYRCMSCGSTSGCS